MVRTDADGFESAQLHLIAMFGAAGQTVGRTIDNCRCQTKHSHIGKTLTIQAIYMTSIPTCTHEETYAAQSMFVQRMQVCCQLQCTCFAYRMLAFTYALSHFAITKQNHGGHLCLATRFPICNKRVAFKPLVWHKPADRPTDRPNDRPTGHRQVE